MQVISFEFGDSQGAGSAVIHISDYLMVGGKRKFCLCVFNIYFHIKLLSY